MALHLKPARKVEGEGEVSPFAGELTLVKQLDLIAVRVWSGLLLPVRFERQNTGQKRLLQKSSETIWLGRFYYMKMESNTIRQAEQQMNTTISNYPDFQTLPTGVKQMLLVSEAHFSGQPASRHQGPKGVAQEMRTHPMKAHPRKRPLTFGDFVAGVYRTWGKRRATGIIDLAIKVHMIEFRGAERFVIS